MEAENRSINISVATLWRVLVKRVWILLAVGIVSFVAVFAWSHLTYTPQYQATAKIFILRQMAEGQTSNDNAYVVSEMITQDCNDLLKGRTVLQKVVDELGLEMTWEQLGACVKTQIPEESRNLSVSVVAASAEEAVAIVNTLCSIGEATIFEVLGEKHARFYEPAVLEEEPCNRPSLLLNLLIAFGAVLVLYIVFVVMFARNEYIGDLNEIEKRLNIVILGDIPNVNSGKSTDGYYYRARQVTEKLRHEGKGDRA